MRQSLLTLSFLAVTLGALAQGQTEQATRETHYRLQAEDKIEVFYRYTPEYNATVPVQPDGFVSLPLIGEVKVVTLTLDQATLLIRSKAADRLADPDITVVLKDYVKPYFVVSGEVAKPGRFDMRGRVTLMEAIAIGGGVVSSGKRTQVLLVHRAGDATAEVRVMNLGKLISRTNVMEDIEVRPGDMIIVPRNTLSKIEPYIRISETALTSVLLGIK